LVSVSKLADGHYCLADKSARALRKQRNCSTWHALPLELIQVIAKTCGEDNVKDLAAMERTCVGWRDAIVGSATHLWRSLVFSRFPRAEAILQSFPVPPPVDFCFKTFYLEQHRADTSTHAEIPEPDCKRSDFIFTFELVEDAIGGKLYGKPDYRKVVSSWTGPLPVDDDSGAIQVPLSCATWTQSWDSYYMGPGNGKSIRLRVQVSRFHRGKVRSLPFFISDTGPDDAESDEDSDLVHVHHYFHSRHLSFGAMSAFGDHDDSVVPELEICVIEDVDPNDSMEGSKSSMEIRFTIYYVDDRDEPMHSDKLLRYLEKLPW